jgi:hypothetical protein
VAEAVEFDDEQSITQRLKDRDSYASWVEETQSLINAGSMKGLDVTLKSGECGWIIFQRSPFQLQHIVIQPNISPELQVALLVQLHLKYPLQDTKVENVPADHSTWDAFQKVGYFEAFSRLEMFLYF